MFSRTIRTGVFVLESLNSAAMVYYFLYLYFFMAERFGFGSRHNLLLAAFTGAVYTIAAIYGGRFGQRRGYFAALKTGFVILIAAMAAGCFAQTVTGHVLVLGVATVGMCFIWPNLEGMVCEGASPVQTQRMVGVYNLVWATTNAVAYFTGGAMIEAFGYRSIFIVPLAIHVLQLGMTLRLERRAALDGTRRKEAPVPLSATDIPPNPRPIARARAFTRMAWIANPLGYIAMSTVVPVIPVIAHDLRLTPAVAGAFCSIWQFGRAGTFLALWMWPGWHYRFRWLAAACMALIVGYVFILSARDLWTLVAMQLIFGAGVGLIYYSSLFYSMEVGESKGEHGGLHEAAIGAGNCVGPLIGAGALTLLPDSPHGSIWTVGVLLVAGVGAVTLVYARAARHWKSA